MRRKVLYLSAIWLSFISGCGKETSSATQQNTNTADIIASVNEKDITRGSFDLLSYEIAQRRGGNKLPDEQVLAELIKRELLSQEAEKKGVMKNPLFSFRMENASRSISAEADAEVYLNEINISDADLKKEYDLRLNSLKTTQFRAKHIVVDTEQQAKDIIAKAVSGSDFSELAKSKSKDSASKDKGGELGWFSLQQVIPPLAQAMTSLQNGQMTAQPIQSKFGWHVIVKEESKEVPAPALDTIKEQLTNTIKIGRLQQHIAELKEKAKITNNFSEGKPSETSAPKTQPSPIPLPSKVEKEKNGADVVH